MPLLGLGPLYHSSTSFQRLLRSSSKTRSLMSTMSESSSFRIALISLLKFSSAALDSRYSCVISLDVRSSKRSKKPLDASSLGVGSYELRLTLASGQLLRLGFVYYTTHIL